MTWRDRLLLSLFLLCVLIPGTIGVSLFDRDEGWYAQITREMVESGDWIIPRYRGESLYFKPPLMYWCTALSTALLGWSEFALRLPCVLAAVAAWLVAAEIAAAWWGRRAGWWTAVIGGTCIGPNLACKLLLADAYLLLFANVTMACWIRRLDVPAVGDIETLVASDLGNGRNSVPASPSRGAYGHAFWIAVGLAVLAKGPAIFVFLVPFGAALILWNAPRGTSWPRRLARAWPGRGWYCAVLVAGPWYVAVMASDWEAFRVGFIRENFVERLRQPLWGHGGSPGYYVATGLLALWPWGAFVPTALAAAWRARRGDVPSRWLLAWIIGPWIVLELIQTKLPHYALPLATPLAMLAARRVVCLYPLRDENDELRMVNAANGVFARGGRLDSVLLIGGVFLAAVGAIVAAWLGGMLPTYVSMMTCGFILLLACAVVAVQRRADSRPGPAFITAAALMALYVVGGAWLAPSAEPLRVSRLVADRANALAGDSLPMRTYGFEEPTMHFYLRRPAMSVRPAESAWREGLAGPFVLVADRADLPELAGVIDVRADDGETIRGFNYVIGKRQEVWIGLARPIESH